MGNFKGVIGKELESHRFDFRDILEDASVEELIEVLSFCFSNTERVESVILENLQLFIKLDKDHWRRVVLKAKAESDYYLRSFLRFVYIYCRVDERYLLDIGVPEEMVREAIAEVLHPDFAFHYPSGKIELNAGQRKVNELKLQSFRDLGLSEAEVWNMYNMFTELENRTSKENPVLI